MRDALGPFSASIGQVRRRAILFLFVAALVVWGLISWSAYTSYRTQAAVIERAEEGRMRPEDPYQIVGGGGLTCTDEQEQVCYFTTGDGRQIGPRFSMEEIRKFPGPDGEDPFVEIIRENLPQLLPPIKAELARSAERLAPLAVIRDRAEAMGTFFGILFVVIITATFIGAEWRWGVWRTLLTHEPRRGRVLMAKFAALWVAVAVGAVVILAVTAGLDAIFRSISDIDASGGPSALTVTRVTARSFLSLELYATAAAAFATTIRTSFAGVGALLFILVDGLATRRFTWLRHILPTQQIATLMPGSIFGNRPGYAWWPLIESGSSRCTSVGPGLIECAPIPLKDIPHWRASVVLVGWIAAFVVATWAVLRARDVPQ